MTKRYEDVIISSRALTVHNVRNVWS